MTKPLEIRASGLTKPLEIRARRDQVGAIDRRWYQTRRLGGHQCGVKLAAIVELACVGQRIRLVSGIPSRRCEQKKEQSAAGATHDAMLTHLRDITLSL